MSHPNHISSEHLPSKNGANGLSGIDPEELEKAVRCGSIDENLDTKHIAEVARFLFSHKDILTQGGFPNIIRANYKGLNLEAHGRPHFITDSLLVIECLNNAINTGEQTSE
ncbi:MAG: hypothetical protein U1C97_01570, partial [Candidatus Gracilibacteria bacterium]|nr:hypothetical protein [Candidatus Gracilibacteria bacterium]